MEETEFLDQAIYDHYARLKAQQKELEAQITEVAEVLKTDLDKRDNKRFFTEYGQFRLQWRKKYHYSQEVQEKQAFIDKLNAELTPMKKAEEKTADFDIGSIYIVYKGDISND